MDELTTALTRLAEALEHQSASINALVSVIASQYLEEDDDEVAEAGVYLDGTPIQGRQ